MRTGRIIPLPIMSESTIDYKFKVQYKDGPKDTTKDLAKAVTFTVMQQINKIK